MEVFSANSMSMAVLLRLALNDIREAEPNTEALEEELGAGVGAPLRCFQTSLRRRPSRSRVEEIMSSTESDQTTITRSSRCQMN